jgi:hypothetical protein
MLLMKKTSTGPVKHSLARSAPSSYIGTAVVSILAVSVPWASQRKCVERCALWTLAFSGFGRSSAAHADALTAVKHVLQ